MRLLVLFCIFLYFVGIIQAAPTSTNTTTSTSSNVPEASFTNRTLWDIVSSCVLTLFACICTAIHSNIPSPKDSPILILWRRLGVMIMALIVPELIVTLAMRQWISARYVTKEFEESGYFGVLQPQEQPRDHGSIEATTEQYVKDRDTEAPTPRYGVTHALAKPFKKLFEAYVSEQSEDYTWTQTHSFFVLMGGFMLYKDRKPYRTLQPKHILDSAAEVRFGPVQGPLNPNAEPDHRSGSGKESERWTGPMRTRPQAFSSSSERVRTSERHT